MHIVGKVRQIVRVIGGGGDVGVQIQPLHLSAQACDAGGDFGNVGRGSGLGQCHPGVSCSGYHARMSRRRKAATWRCYAAMAI